jgi:acetolactate synthase-1/2/3 large subunit
MSQSEPPVPIPAGHGQAPPSLARTLLQELKARGTVMVFGVPGGGSSLDLIDAADAEGLPFILTANETSAALMAAVQAEITGAPGVVLTGVGPGAAAVANGVAYASLERVPLVVVTDRIDDEAGGVHQKFDQLAMFRPLVKAGGALVAEDGPNRIVQFVDQAMAQPQGPVHVDLSAREAGRPVSGSRGLALHTEMQFDGEALERARALLEGARKPVLLVGLEARAAPAARAAAALAHRLGCPALTTYKAKGVIPDRVLHMIGHFTNGAAEGEALRAADLVITFGLDPVEAINQPWPSAAPILEITSTENQPMPQTAAAKVVGDLGAMVERLDNSLAPKDWTKAELAALRVRMHSRLATGQQARRSAKSVIETAWRLAPPGTRLTVDAGAHMLSTLAFWPADRPFGALKSNGLSTMGYALPAAIAASLLEPLRPVLAVTGDGGLAMCVAELATALRHNCNITVLVMNDSALSLIDIKQARQGRARLGVSYPRMDFAAIARGFGVAAWSAGLGDALGGAISEALAHEGPSLVDATVDPTGYAAQLEALRG